MKVTFTFLFALALGSALAQPNLNKSVPYQTGQKIRMNFDYPNLVRVSTWDKNEVSIEGVVSVNGGEDNDAFQLNVKAEGNIISISNEMDLKGIPQRITIVKDGQKMVFKDKAAWEKYKDEHGRGFDRMNNGAEIDIVLDIKVPRNAETIVEATYGMVEVKNFNAPLTVKATYGGVDAAIAEKSVGEIKAETNYGHIYSGLETKFNGKEMVDEDFHMVVSAKPGSGPRYAFESPYGNVYLRKNQ